MFCPICGTELKPETKFCPSCGIPVSRIFKSALNDNKSTKDEPKIINKKKVSKKSHLIWFILLLTIIFIVIFANLPTKYYSSPIKSDYQKIPNATKDFSIRYIHKKANIRDGPGKNYEITGVLMRGEKVEIDSIKNGWADIYKNNIFQGYVHESLLEITPIPNFEIVSWNWYKDASFGIDGAVIWNVQVRNNTNNYVGSLMVEFTTFDAAGNIIDSDYGYVTGLSPGGTASTKGYATYFGKEKKASIRIGQ